LVSDLKSPRLLLLQNTDCGRVGLFQKQVSNIILLLSVKINTPESGNIKRNERGVTAELARPLGAFQF
jgi:hypothetical protein